MSSLKRQLELDCPPELNIELPAQHTHSFD